MRALSLVGLLLGAAAAAQGSERVLTLEQSVQTGLQNSQALLAARDDVRLAQQRIAESRSLNLPTLVVNMNASRYRADDYMALPGDFGSTLFLPSDEPDSFYAGRLSLRQLLYNGGRNRATIHQAEAALEQARLQEEEIRNHVTADVSLAFFDFLLARKHAELINATRRDIAVLAEGRGTDDDVVQTSLDALGARLRREMAERRRNEERARLAFVSALGLELYTDVQVSGELATSPVQEPLAKLLARAQEARLEIRGREYQREIDRLAVRLSEAERNPVVAFGAAYELNNNDFPLDRSYWNATLNVNLPLFDGFASRARIRQTRIQADKSRITRAAIEDRINQEVRESYGEALFWQAEMQDRKNDLDRLTGKVQRVPGGRRAATGAGLHLDLLETAEAYWESVHAHRVARIKLERAVGLPLAP